MRPTGEDVKLTVTLSMIIPITTRPQNAYEAIVATARIEHTYERGLGSKQVKNEMGVNFNHRH